MDDKIISLKDYNGNLYALYKAWSNYVNSFVSPDHKMLLPIIALQEILFKDYDGNLFIRNNKIVKIQSVGADGTVSIEANSPYDIMPKEEEWIEAGDWKHEHDGLRRHPVAVKNHYVYFQNKELEYLEIGRSYEVLVNKIENKELLLLKDKLFRAASSIVPLSHLSSIKRIVLHEEKTDKLSRIKEGEAVGTYSMKTGEMHVWGGLVRTGQLVHELGHAFIHKMYEKDLYRDTIEAVWEYCKENNWGFVSEYAKKNAHEFFAESYYAYMMMPDSFASRNSLMKELLDKMTKEAG